MVGSKALRELRKELRKCNCVLLGDPGVMEAWRNTFAKYGIKPLPSTKRQREILDIYSIKEE